MPVIPRPVEGSAAVFVAGEGFSGPFFKGDGAIDLVCGRCLHRLAEALHPGQIQNLVLQCPACHGHNVVVSIHALENFVSQVQSVPAAPEKITHLKVALENAREKKSSTQEVMALIEEIAPDFDTIKELLVPKGPGDFYGLLGFVIGFLAWLQARKQSKQPPSVVINNYFSERDPFRGVGPNEICPCGSGKKYKRCHGK
ncbi:SEC-C metal-binding domain-containing protein [Rubrivivax gelatinosus]|uniref:SEC-C metal-binding domain-containing protein n=1 Tax=Rubrivivax gelatinosus TaxID=28068 RepID=UPI00130E8A47|nr:SEC-C metal-binding domain-containing protein [Rubrivivax gelatinosus]